MAARLARLMQSPHRLEASARTVMSDRIPNRFWIQETYLGTAPLLRALQLGILQYDMVYYANYQG
jgi:hypothetical protein